MNLVPVSDIRVPDIYDVEPDIIPDKVAEFFLRCARRLVPEPQNQDLRDFDKLMCIDFVNDKTWVGAYTQQYAEDITETHVQLLEHSWEGDLIGHGEIKFMHRDHADAKYAGIPCMGLTATAEKYLRRGYGLRRLIVMNSVANLVFGRPLHCSRKIINDTVHRQWQRLQEAGLAETIDVKEGSPFIYRFIE